MKLQDNLVYQIAILELQLLPLMRQVNQSISHLKTIQYYIDNQGDKIAQLVSKQSSLFPTFLIETIFSICFQKGKAFINRLNNYLDQWRTHVISEMDSGVSKCRPLWEILKGMRLLLCNHILGPLVRHYYRYRNYGIFCLLRTKVLYCSLFLFRMDSGLLR